MEVNFYHEFIVLAKFQNYTEAAFQLSMSESTLSRHIKSMEAELGFEFFDRSKRNISITEYGKILLPYAKQFIALQQNCHRDFVEASKANKRTVVVGTAYYINDLLSSFYLHNDQFTIKIVHSNESSEELLELLKTGVCELAFIIDVFDPLEAFIALPFDTDYYVAITSYRHSLSKRKSIQLNELTHENFISFKSNSFGDVNLKKICAYSGFEPNIVLNADVGSTIASFVKEGLGVSVLQKKTLSKMHVYDVSVIDIEPKINIHISLCYLKETKLSSAAKAIIDYALKAWPIKKH